MNLTLRDLYTKRRQLSAEMERIATEATIAAIQAATAATPPIDAVSGAHTRSGELKAHWATDSITEPQRRGNRLITRLANTIEYASYVNDGHRMDRHFVPGLYINPYSGQLEYDAARRNEVGIVVGTKTDYVPGLHMVEAGENAYLRTAMRLSKGLEDILE